MSANPVCAEILEASISKRYTISFRGSLVAFQGERSSRQAGRAAWKFVSRRSRACRVRGSLVCVWLRGPFDAMGTSHSKNVLDLKAELDKTKKVNSRLRGHLTRERKTANMASQLALQGGDPRWDEHAFAEWLLLNKEGHYAICLVRIGYLRRSAFWW